MEGRNMRISPALAVLAAATGLTLAPLAVAPTAGADVCGDVGGRHVSVGGCTNIAGDVAAGAVLAGADEEAGQIAAGLPPCYTPAGIPFRTPNGVPCP